MTQYDNISSIHDSILVKLQGSDPEANYCASFENLLERYSKLPQFESAFKKIGASDCSPNQAMTGYDGVKAEVISTDGGITSVLMQIAKSARHIGSSAQEGVFRIVESSSPVIVRKYCISGYSGISDVQEAIDLKLIDTHILEAGDIGRMHAGPFAYQFEFEPPGVIIHRLHSEVAIPLVHHFDQESLKFQYTTFPNQEHTRDHFFGCLTRHLAVQIAKLSGRNSADPELADQISVEVNSIVDFHRKVAQSREYNPVTRWASVQTVSIFRPETAVAVLESMKHHDTPNLSRIASGAQQKLNSYLASQK